ALGPRLPDGRRVLLLISDDNFNAELQRTQIFAFAVDEAPAAIGAIQGTAHRSPRKGSWLFGVEGVVTAVSGARGLEGFWIESERPDSDPATSEGLFVAWPGEPVTSGQRVALDAYVVEAAASPAELPVTRLLAESLELRPGVTRLEPPRRLPASDRAPRAIDDDGLARFEPTRDAIDWWESVEGMRVEVGPGVVSGATTRHGELVLLPDAAPPGPRSAAGGALRGPDDAPLERVMVSGRLVGGLPALNVGARIEQPLIGVVDYAFSNYKLLLLAPLESQAPSAPCTGGTALVSDPAHLTIATFNVENLSAAGPPERFERLGRVIAEPLGGPALVSLQEIQDDSGPADDGVVSSRATIARLVAGIAAAGGPAYEAVWIDPENGREGGQPGGNIRVALLADPARARIVRRGTAGPLDAAEPVRGADGLHLSPSPGRVAPSSAAFTLESGEGVRRSLAVELEAGGRPLFVVVNHLSSKYEDDRDYGAIQPPRRPTGARRLAQAEAIRAWAEQLLELDPEARLVVLGDLNDYEWSPAVRRLAAPPLENLILRLPEPERTTYVFEGAAQAIDHVIVSPALAAGAAADILHLNADCADPFRTSDHDPVLVRLGFP
ncbi:MAG TPA: endonuclease/exonuclease/phosphatase family protein, partial [Acidobacteriota bacterium]